MYDNKHVLYSYSLICTEKAREGTAIFVIATVGTAHLGTMTLGTALDTKAEVVWPADEIG